MLAALALLPACGGKTEQTKTEADSLRDVLATTLGDVDDLNIFLDAVNVSLDSMVKMEGGILRTYSDERFRVLVISAPHSALGAWIFCFSDMMIMNYDTSPLADVWCLSADFSFVSKLAICVSSFSSLSPSLTRWLRRCSTRRRAGGGGPPDSRQTKRDTRMPCRATATALRDEESSYG